MVHGSANFRGFPLESKASWSGSTSCFVGVVQSFVLLFHLRTRDLLPACVRHKQSLTHECLTSVPVYTCCTWLKNGKRALACLTSVFCLIYKLSDAFCRSRVANHSSGPPLRCIQRWRKRRLQFLVVLHAC